jgi:hypothetical protein
MSINISGQILDTQIEYKLQVTTGIFYSLVLAHLRKSSRIFLVGKFLLN